LDIVLSLIWVCYRVGYNIKKGITEDFFYKDKDSQIAAIEKTFDKTKEPVSTMQSDILLMVLSELFIHLNVKAAWHQMSWNIIQENQTWEKCTNNLRKVKRFK
jgi:hypothetical protein